MEVSVAAQTVAFLESMLLGAAAGAIYGIFSAVRQLNPNGRLWVLFWDLFYFFLMAVVSFLFFFCSGRRNDPGVFVCWGTVWLESVAVDAGNAVGKGAFFGDSDGSETRPVRKAKKVGIRRKNKKNFFQKSRKIGKNILKFFG